MKILVWHVHGGWMNSFLRGNHEYYIPFHEQHRVSLTGPNIHEVSPQDLADVDIDVVVLQRTEELALAEGILGLVPGSEIPAVFVEHNTPKLVPVTESHPMRCQRNIPVVHVTHFNRLAWDCGDATTWVIEHGVPDPGDQYVGDRESFGVVINEPVRRNRIVGTDLLPAFAEVARLDCFGIDTDLLPRALGLGRHELHAVGDVPTSRLHAELARTRAYLHLCRWTSLGLSLIEAMMLGMPVLALATTEAPRAVPPEAGCISSDLDELVATARLLRDDPDEARRRGQHAREFALEHYGLDKFLAAWDDLFSEVSTKGTRR